MHTNRENIPAFTTAVKPFTRPKKDEINIMLSGGDLHADISVQENSFINKFMNFIGLDASADGNHELEGGKYFIETNNTAPPKFKWLACNLKIKNKESEKDFSKSTIIEKNGIKIGLIGVAPLDFEKLAFITKDNDFIKVHKLRKTIRDIKKEVKATKDAGADVIVLLAHTGEKSQNGRHNYYERFAKINGISAIIGGHDHIQIDKWIERNHLKLEKWKLKREKESVKVVATGRTAETAFGENLDCFGSLHLELDDNHKVIPEKSKNQFIKVTDYAPSSIMEKIISKYFNEKEVLAQLPKPLICNSKLTEENKTASLIADSTLWLVNKLTKGNKADFAFVNSGTVRDDFKDVNVTAEHIKQILPFASAKLIKTELTKKQIIDTLNWGVKSTTLGKISPGVMQVSGLRYTIGKDLKVKDVCIVNADGSVKENISKASDKKKYTVVYDDFLMTGVAGLKDLKKNPFDKNVEYFSYSRRNAITKYLKENGKNADLSCDAPRIIKEV